jgi:hypothetical protein
MIEVFKTDVREQHHAEMLIAQIRDSFKNYTATFDLADCDKILRVSAAVDVAAAELIKFLKDCGVDAEVLAE